MNLGFWRSLQAGISRCDIQDHVENQEILPDKCWVDCVYYNSNNSCPYNNMLLTMKHNTRVTPAPKPNSLSACGVQHYFLVSSFYATLS